MRVIVTTACLIAISLHSVAETKYYQCKNERGETEFSQRPCGDSAVAKSIDAPALSGSVARDADDWDRIMLLNREADIDREIAVLERKIRSLESERDAKLAKLKDRTRYANNNLAGAQYRESLATEMSSVNDQYQSKIGVKQDKIGRLEAEAANLD